MESYSRNKAMILLLLISAMHYYSQTVVGQVTDCATTPGACECTGTDIICASRSLTEVPTFKTSSNIYRHIYITGNKISTIRAGDFMNVKTNGAVYISLANNQHALTFEEDAFIALGNVNISLNLSNITMDLDFKYKLRRINITELHIDKPTKLDSETLFALSDTLKTFTLGMQDLIPQQWPVELRLLRNMGNFTVMNENLIAIPDTAFHGMEHNIHHLTFRDTRLLRFPDAVCPLSKLVTLAMYHHKMSAQNTPVPNCEQPMNSVQSLELVDVGLTLFPDIFDTFPLLSYLKVTNNPGLEYVGDNVAPSTSIVRAMDLSSNGLQQIPYSIKTMLQLRDLNLSNNKITVIQSNDFESTPPLHMLGLSGNPLVFISDSAFKPLTALRHLDLSNANLTVMPKAIEKLSSPIETIDITNNGIECNCDLTWMYFWPGIQTVKLIGNCKFSKEPYQYFIDNHLHECID